MPRTGRLVIPGQPYHVVHRGHDRQGVFRSRDDFLWYLKRLRKNAIEHGLLVLAYCLMTNHVHLLVVPLFETSLALAIGNTHGKHSARFRHRYGGHGTIWSGRFWSEVVPEDRFWVTFLYVEQNPRRAKMVERADQYEWSSARAHVEGIDAHDILDRTLFTNPKFRQVWSRELGIALPQDVLQALRRDREAGFPNPTQVEAIAHEKARLQRWSEIDFDPGLARW